MQPKTETPRTEKAATSWCDSILESARLERELRAANQVATENKDWFDALVNDVAEILGCEKKPTAILAACAQLKTEATAAAKLLQDARNINLDQVVSQIVSKTHRGLLDPHEASFEANIRGILVANARSLPPTDAASAVSASGSLKTAENTSDVA